MVVSSHAREQMFKLLHANARAWREIARLDSSYENYREIATSVLLMYGEKSDSKAVNLAMEQLATILPQSETKEFPKLDHFGIERTAPREVARAVSDYFLKYYLQKVEQDFLLLAREVASTNRCKICGGSSAFFRVLINPV